MWLANGCVIVIDCAIAACANIDARSRQGAASVPGTAGTNFRESAKTERLEVKVRRIDVDGPTAVDWSKFSTASRNFVSIQSKDVLVACWGCYGLFHMGGSQGLAVGLGVLQKIADAHWERLYPRIKRERARVGAIDRLVSRVGLEVAKHRPTEADYPAVLSAYDVLDDLDRELHEKLVNEQVIERADRMTNGSSGPSPCTAKRAAEGDRSDQRTPTPAESTPSADGATRTEDATNLRLAAVSV
ncbi:type VI secretion system ImpA family N-terminal domain-containing protein [Bradyrhizobium sp. PMVTL-01]|uniref:type VI secretion system ImpA family N-terminal domain-containing protein n=1 Tax=Bradyrhizobium sp. PMVTL-01 TaxID=3434999 RepID=UPI003F71396F